MPLHFPQHIKIQNARLQVLSTLLYCIVAAALLTRFVAFRQYGQKLPVHGTGSIFVEGLDNASRLWERGQHKLSEAFCSEPHAFDFWYDDSGSLRYENHTCLQVCARSALNPRHRCLDSDELADHEGPQSVALVTHVQESDSRLTTTRNYFVPSVDALSIRLLFTYRVPSLQWYQTTMATSYGTSHSSRYDVHTVAMDSSGKPWKTFAPGADPTLSLHDLLFLSGAGPLDRPQRLAGRNFNPDVSTEVAEAGPSGRISRMELTIRLQCGNMRLSDTGIELAYEENTCVLLPCHRDMGTNWNQNEAE